MEVDHRKDPREVLIEVAKALSGTRDVEVLLDQIVERARVVMHCEVCSILLPADDEEHLNIRSTREVGSMDVEIPIEGSIAGEVYRTRKVSYTGNAQEDERHFKGIDNKTGLVTSAMLTIPLLHGDDCLGVLQAINPVDRPDFNSIDESVFEIFGSLVAVTLIRIKAEESAVREASVRREFTLAQEIQIRSRAASYVEDASRGAKLLKKGDELLCWFTYPTSRRRKTRTELGVRAGNITKCFVGRQAVSITFE